MRIKLSVASSQPNEMKRPDPLSCDVITQNESEADETHLVLFTYPMMLHSISRSHPRYKRTSGLLATRVPFRERYGSKTAWSRRRSPQSSWTDIGFRQHRTMRTGRRSGQRNSATLICWAQRYLLNEIVFLLKIKTKLLRLLIVLSITWINVRGKERVWRVTSFTYTTKPPAFRCFQCMLIRITQFNRPHTRFIPPA